MNFLLNGINIDGHPCNCLQSVIRLIISWKARPLILF